MKEATYGVLLWVAVIGAFVLIPCSCNRVQRTNADAAKDLLDDFCKATNAAPAFKGLPDANLLTIDLQRSLLGNEKRVAFKAGLGDIWKSKAYDSLMAGFKINVGDTDIIAYLKCSESQAQKLHDEYRRNQNTIFLIAADFERADTWRSDSGSDSKADSKRHYDAIGTLVNAQVAKYKDLNSDSDDSD